MTEMEWDSCANPAEMLQFLLDSGRPSDRKLRLFACGCYRPIWHLLTDDRSRKAVEASERYADGLSDRQELAAARNGARATVLAVAWGAARVEAISAAREAAEDAGRLTAGAAMQAARHSPPTGATPESMEASARTAGWAAAHLTQSDLLRCILGNPFRPPLLDAAWLRWNDGTVPKIAQAIYEERAFDRMPILADALEEAGCTSREILFHCRSHSGHVRGCWVIDLLLNKA